MHGMTEVTSSVFGWSTSAICFCLQTLYLASMLIKALWNNALAAKAQLSKQSSFASLLSTNLPMGNKKGECVIASWIFVNSSSVGWKCTADFIAAGILKFGSNSALFI